MRSFIAKKERKDFKIPTNRYEGYCSFCKNIFPPGKLRMKQIRSSVLVANKNRETHFIYACETCFAGESPARDN